MSNNVEAPIPLSRNSESDGGDNSEHDPHYEPIISLPLVNVSTNEEDEIELCKIRARLYRFDKDNHEWKERGTGDIKLLHHKDHNSVRVVMRRDKTLKICANHFITPDLQLNPHCGSDRAFNWTVFADFADETAKREVLAIKFRNADIAATWKSKFLEAQDIVKTRCKIYTEEPSPETTDDESDNSLVKSSDDIKSNSSATDKDNSSKKECDGVVLNLSQLKLDAEDKINSENPGMDNEDKKDF